MESITVRSSLKTHYLFIQCKSFSHSHRLICSIIISTKILFPTWLAIPSSEQGDFLSHQQIIKEIDFIFHASISKCNIDFTFGNKAVRVKVWTTNLQSFEYEVGNPSSTSKSIQIVLCLTPTLLPKKTLLYKHWLRQEAHKCYKYLKFIQINIKITLLKNFF